MPDVDIGINIDPIGKFARAIEANAAKALEALEPYVLLGAEEVREQIALRTPVGARGALRSSFFSRTKLIRSEIIGEVRSPLEYAIPVERGTRPHWPPRAEMELWVKRVIGARDENDAKSTAFLIARAISRRGTLGKFMARDGFRASRPRIMDILRRGMKHVADTLIG